MLTSPLPWIWWCGTQSVSVQPALCCRGSCLRSHHQSCGPPPGKHSCKCAAAGCRLCAQDQVSTSTALSSTGIHGCAQNERSMTPCEKSKSGSEQGAAAQRAAVALEMPPQCRCAAAGLLAVVRDDIDHSLPSTICRMVTRISLAVLAGVGLRRAAPAAIQQDACRRHARGRWHGLLADDASERPWATGLGMVSKRRYRMSIGSMSGIRRNFVFKASSSAINSTRRASSQFAISASSCAIVSGRGRRNAIRRAIASCTVRLTEMFAGEPEVK